MRAKYIILLAACSIALLAARAERPLFQAELDVTNAVEYIAGQAYRVDGRVGDRSVLGYDGDSVRVGDLVFTESILGDVDAWRVTNIVFASALHVRLDVAYLPDGETNGIEGMPIGPAALCTIATNTDIGFPQPPSMTGALVSEHLLNEIRSYSFRLIPGTWHDYGLGEVVTNLAFELATTTGAVATLAGDVAAVTGLVAGLPQGATIAAGSADSVTRSGTNLVITWNTNAAGGGGSGDAERWYEYPAKAKATFLAPALWDQVQFPEHRALTNSDEVIFDTNTWENVFDASESYAVADLVPDWMGNISDADLIYFETYTNVNEQFMAASITSMTFKVTGRLEIGGWNGVWCPIRLYRDVWGGWGEWVAADDYTIESNEWQTLVYSLDCSMNPINMAIGERPVLSFGYGPSHQLPPNEKLYIREISLVSVNGRGLPAAWQVGGGSNDAFEINYAGENRLRLMPDGDLLAGGLSLAGTYATATSAAATAYTTATNARHIAIAASNLASSAKTTASAALPKSGGTMTGTLNMGGNALTNAGNLRGSAIRTESLRVSGGSPFVGAVLAASNASGDTQWQGRRTYVSSLTTQTTNTATHVVTCGFTPSAVVCFTGIAGQVPWALGFVSASGTSANLGVYYAGVVQSNYEQGLGRLHLIGSKDYRLGSPTFTSTGLTFKPSISAGISTNTVLILMLLME